MTGQRPTERPQGEPLLVLALIIGGWLSMRVILWQPLYAPNSLLASARPTASLQAAVGPERTSSGATGAARPVLVATADGGGKPGGRVPLPVDPLIHALTPVLASTDRAPLDQVAGQKLLPAATFAGIGMQEEIIAAKLASPHSIESSLANQQPLLGRRVSLSARSQSRWSADGWLMWRNGSSGPVQAGAPSYGRSQAGVVLRYRLARASGHRPFAYARISRALAGPQETEAAAGLSARPLAGIPISIAAEMRTNVGPVGPAPHPAVFAVTELPPAKLPLGLRAETYAQAGYVGGRFATAFVDGDARLDLQVANLGKHFALRGGAGVWGGAQKHAARLDIGPSAAVRFLIGEASFGVALDYRFRVAGEASPKSGPAMTFSAGF